MKNSKLLSLTTVLGILIFSIVSCSGGAETEDSKTTDSGFTTEMLINEANDIGEEAFIEKYPPDSEIELSGEARFPATWDDKIAVKFGPDMNNLPITADFMFTDNGGTKESTDDKITSGEILHFKGKIGMVFFSEDGKLSRLSLSSCKVQ